MSGESQMVPDTTADPTVMVTEAIARGLNAERDYTAAKIDVLLARLNAMDEATKVLHETVTRTPTDIQLAIGHLQALHAEKFSSVQKQFDERDTRSERECLSADELILCADLIWRPAGELKVGDQLIAFDEETLPGRKGRCYRRAVVTANSLRPDRLLTVNTTRGSVRCNAQHPWLARDTHDNCWKWKQAIDLKPGSTVMSVLDVWQVEQTYEVGWLAGILDGEGYLKQQEGTKIIIAQVLGPLDDEIGFALRDLGVRVKRYSKAAVGNAREQSIWQIGSRPEVMRLLGICRPKRLMLGAGGVWEGRALFSQSRSTATRVTSVEEAGMGTIAMLSTSTGTYIGAGFAHHNSRDNKVAVDAAFAAQKEAAAKQDEANAKAIDKSEKATAETIKTNQELSKSTTDAMTKSLDEVKLTLASIESARRGGKETLSGINALAGFLVSLLVLGGILAAMGAFK